MQSLLNHASLIDCRRLFLRNYAVSINIGVHDFEKRGEQRVLINVDLYVPLALSTPRTTTLDEVVDYDFIRRSIAQRARARPHPPAGNAVRRRAGADARPPQGARGARVHREARCLPRLRRGRL